MQSFRIGGLVGAAFLAFACSANDEGADVDDVDAVTSPFAAGAAPAPASFTPGTNGGVAVGDRGALAYSLPIFAAPAAGNLAPALSIEYSSQAGPGLVGIGGSLRGLSAIGRCPRTIAEDGASSEIDFDDNDRFCLDGERLVAVAGVYGADQTEYRTALDSLTRVVSYGRQGNGPAYFRAWMKSGQILDFGTTASSRIEASGGSTTVRTWSVAKIADRFSNYMDVAYSENNTTGAFVPTKVSFGANANAGTAHTGSITLQYESARASVQYIGGTKVSLPFRLSRVLSYEGAVLVRDYRLEYDTSGPLEQSRLVAVTECDKANVCLKPTQLEWASPKPIRGTPAVWGTGLTESLLGDFNGDGKTDLAKIVAPNVYVALSTGTSFGAWKAWATTIPGDQAHVGDINGDGKADLYLTAAANFTSSPPPPVKALLSNGAGFTAVDTGIDKWWFSGLGGTTVFAADLNNDGRSDLVTVQYLPDTTIVAWLSKAVGTTVPATTISQVAYRSSMVVLGVSDLTGDGAAEVAAIMDGKVVLKSVAGALETTAATVPISDSLRLADINGDGKDDVISLGTYTTDSKAWLATGRGLLAAPTVFGTGLSKNESLIDMNGDGHPDMVQADNAFDIWVQLATHEGFPASSPHWHMFVSPSKALKVQFGDFNGDGFPDVLQNDAGSARVTINPIGLHDVVTAVVDGRGTRTEVTYAQPSVGGAIYEPSAAGARYPEQETAPSIPVVARLVTPNGAGGSRVRMFKYVGGRVNLQGRGFSGFERVIQRDMSSGAATSYLETETAYRTDFPYVGLVASQRRSHVAGTARQLLTEVTNSYANVGANGAAMPVQTKTIEKSWDLSGAPLPTVTTTAGTFDLGTATLMVSDVGGYKKTTRLTYTHDLTDWKLHRLTRASVTHEAPATLALPAITRTTGFTYYATTGALKTETIEPDDNANLERTTTYGYDDFGNRDVVTISGPTFPTRTTRSTYDATGRFAEVTKDTLGYVARTTYDPRFGLPLTTTDANGLQTKSTYDNFGRKVTETSPAGIVTTYATTFCDSTCPPGAVYRSTTTRTGASTATVYFDALGRDVRTEAPAPFDGQNIVSEKQYDASGRTYRTSLPRFETDTAVRWASTLYDALDRPVKVTDPMGRSTTYEYDGLVTTKRSHIGQVSTTTKNAQGRVVAVDESGIKTRHKYDVVGSLIAITDANGNVSRMTYDRIGRKLSSVDPSTGTWRYTYDGLGQLLTEEDQKKQQSTMSYDLAGRLLERIAPDHTATFTYDGVNGIGKVASERTTGSIGRTLRTYEYDAKSRVVSSAVTIDEGLATAQTFVTGTTYDSLGRESTIKYPNGIVTRTVYNARSFPVRLERVNGTTVTPLWTALAVDARGQVTRESRGNELVTTRAFDLLGRVTRASTPSKSGLACIPATCAPDYTSYDETKQSDATGCAYNADAGEHQRLPSGCTDETPQEYSVAYDEVGRLTQRNDKVAGLAETFAHDALDRLTSVSGGTNKTFEYDDVGNITFKSDVGRYVYSAHPYAADAITGTVNTSFAYDVNGNTLSGNGRSYTWTAANMPRRVTRGAAFVQFDYDARHQRVKQIDHKGARIYYGASGFEHVFHADGRQTIRVGLSSPAGLLGQIVTNVSATNAKTESTTYFLTDHLGSVQVVTSSTGGVLQRLSYDAHGLRRFTNGVDADVGEIAARTTRGFSGHEMLDGVGLVNMNARLYDPLLGRFVSPDSKLQFPFTTQGQNRYSYTDNHPLSAVDPSGHGWFSSIFRVFAMIFVMVILPELSWFMAEMQALANALYINVKIVTGVVVGSISGVVSTGSLKGAILGGISGGLFAGAGFVGKAGSMMRQLAHGAAGAVTAALSGGSVKAGFLSATFRGIGGDLVEKVPNELPARVAAAAAVGGVGSVLGGGKFENGAVTGAFGELFNHQSDRITGKACYRDGYQPPAAYDGPSMTPWNGTSVSPGERFAGKFAMAQVESFWFLAKATALGWVQTGIDTAVELGLLPDDGGVVSAAFDLARPSRSFTRAESDLMDIANSYRGGLIPRQDAEVLVGLAREIGLDRRARVDIDEFTRARTDPIWKTPHVHFPGLKEHGIPIADGPFSPYHTVRP